MSKVVFWLGPAVETFDFATALGTGIGGSETAAIHLSRGLAALGHDVDVYADVASPAAWSDFVSNSGGASGTLRAIPYRCWVPRTPCDVFVSSRSADARRVLLPHCRAAWLWVHDLHCGPDWEDSIGSDYDRVLCLSAWAREAFLRFYPGLDGSRVLVTSNAVDPTLFEGSPGNKLDKHLDYALGRAPLRVTYSSSPDRGLDKLLDLWPTIYETCFRASRQPPEDLRPEDLRPEGLRPEGLRPDATRVCGPRVCGPSSTSTTGSRRGGVWRSSGTTWRQSSRLGGLEERLRTTPGVHYHGRAGQAEVARSYAQSQLWLYPTDFLEVSCITAMEAQAAGCKVVATRCGVLPETAPHAWFVDGKTSDPGYDARFLETVWAALADDMVACKTPPSWSDVALQWDAWVWEVGK